MNGTAALQSAFAGAHNWFLGTVGDVDATQANTVPPGVAHPIGELMAHILHSEDFMINMAIQGQPPLWEKDGWKDKVGGEMILAQTTEGARAYTSNPEGLASYAQAVFANTDAFLGGLSENDLDRPLTLEPLGLPNMSMGAFLTQMLLGNTYAHTGEISALKGLRGKKGYPF